MPISSLATCCKAATLLLLLGLVVLLTAVADSDHHPDTTPTNNVTFIYIYRDEAFHHRTELERCDPGGADGMTTDPKHGLGDVLLDYLTSNQSNQFVVTESPEEADWFWVPFNVDRSHGEKVMQCGQTHLGRLNKVLDALEASPYYQRAKGADHVWYLGGWQLTTAGIGILPYFPFRRHVLHHMTIIRYADERSHLPGTQLYDDPVYGWDIMADARALPQWWAQGKDHRCTVNVPHRSHPAIQEYHDTIYQDQQTLEEWEQARPYLFHFVGAGDDYPYNPGRAQMVHALNAVWHETIQQFPSDQVFNVKSPLSPDAFAESLSKSRFCLVIRGDDPSRSRFADAISAGCIPVLVSDGFGFFAAGHGRKTLNYETFSISIPESLFLTHGPSALHYATNLNRNELREMHRSLMQVRPQLLWNLALPEQSRVAEMALEELNVKCKLEESELAAYKQDTPDTRMDDSQNSQKCSNKPTNGDDNGQC